MPTRVLVVDDDPSVREMLRLVLSLEDMDVEVAEDGVAGLALAQRMEPDLIVLDMMMPGMDGLEVAQRLAADPRLSAIPVIICSALAASDEMWTGRLGDLTCIGKPFDTEEFVSAVLAALARSGAREALSAGS